MSYSLQFRGKKLKWYGDEDRHLEFPIPGSETEVIVCRDGVTKTWSWKIEAYGFYVSSDD